MHETLGDGYITEGGIRIYADEEVGVRDATQLRHQEANSFQEEIANVIRAEGITLHGASETIAQMTQLNAAIDSKVGKEAVAREAKDTLQDAEIAANASAIALNTTHRGSDGKDHSDVVLNNTHRGSDGKDHSDVVLNNAHRISTANPHTVTASQLTDLAERIALSPAKATNTNPLTAQAGAVDNVTKDVQVKRIGSGSGQFVLVEIIIGFDQITAPTNYWKLDLDDCLGAFVNIQGNSLCALDLDGTWVAGYIHGSAFDGEMTIWKLDHTSIPVGTDYKILGNFVGTAYS